MSESVAIFFLFVVVVGDKAKIPVAVHKYTTPVYRHVVDLGLDCGIAHIKVARDIGYNHYFIAVSQFLVGYIPD